MKTPNQVPTWNDLLPNIEAIATTMKPDELEQAGRACDQYVMNLAHGISGIGNLLACTASNGETGLSEDAATDVGWLLESLGTLIANLADTGAAIQQQRNALKREG